ncbi:MAG TPA: hypothetical protein VL995_19105 [Cellvibrio sp.]|nr:hypothetical protein [Cellvibrio sp.]
MFRYIWVLAFFICSNANAIQWIKGKVTAIEITYMPGTLVFSLDAGNTACPTGKAMKWQHSSVDNNKVAHSTVLAAMLAGKKLHVVIEDNDTNCVVKYLHILNE